MKNDLRGQHSISNAMRIDVHHEHGHLLIRPYGDIDAHSAPALRHAFAAIAAAESVLVDLGEVSFMDSSGIGTLIGGIRRARAAGRPMAIAYGRTSTQRVLTLTGLDAMVPNARTVDAAATLLALPAA